MLSFGLDGILQPQIEGKDVAQLALFYRRKTVKEWVGDNADVLQVQYKGETPEKGL